jgi:hypothetical protein
MKRYMWAALALCIASGAGAQTKTQDGSPTNTQQGSLVNGLNRADSTARNLTSDTNGNLMTLEALPLSEISLGPIRKQYFDTLSTNGRTVDSLLTPVDVHNLSAVTFAVKLEGGWTGTHRFLMTVRFHPALLADSSSTWPVPAYSATSPQAWSRYGLPDSIGTVTQGSTTARWQNEATLVYVVGPTTAVGWPGLWNTISVPVPPGVAGASYVIRYLNGPRTAAGGNPGPARIRVDCAGRAL